MHYQTIKQVFSGQTQFSNSAWGDMKARNNSFGCMYMYVLILAVSLSFIRFLLDLSVCTGNIKFREVS